MSRIPRLSPDQIPEAARPFLQSGAQIMGFDMHDGLDMARNPQLLSAVSQMITSIYGPGRLEPALKRLIGHVASTAAGCYYCRQHTAYGSHQQGVEAKKISAAWAYNTSGLFTEAEQAALKVAHLGSLSPSEVTDADFEDLRRHFSEDECLEIVAVIAMFGFLNRWNAVMDTDIENVPADYAKTIGLEPR
ncbi:MAG: carboxymuconolactone decarboxylase family protein [Hyphomonadaceae bacterium]|nr:carboxymuconolactone decarboxylase family protein [Hyphomonadaceae bacterium]